LGEPVNNRCVRTAFPDVFSAVSHFPVPGGKHVVPPVNAESNQNFIGKMFTYPGAVQQITGNNPANDREAVRFDQYYRRKNCIGNGK
jgi:hypothetical protein